MKFPPGFFSSDTLKTLDPKQFRRQSKDGKDQEEGEKLFSGSMPRIQEMPKKHELSPDPSENKLDFQTFASKFLSPKSKE